ncbi:MAG: gamma-butyrobetaine hydroxylase-like domain-containing protein [Rhodospirillaceae bacterium]
MPDGKYDSSVWPSDISYQPRTKILKVVFDNGDIFTLPAEYLRVESPSAEVQAHGGEKIIIGGRRHVGIIEIEPVGNYAVRLVFDDLHDTGIYSWATLHDLGTTYAEKWAAYLGALEEKGLSREP